jgi:thiol-disulfide isomerase/thioredoxin
MKLKIRFPDKLWPFRKQKPEYDDQEEKSKDKRQTVFIVALLIVWLMIFLLTLSKCSAQDVRSLKVGDSVPDITIEHVVNARYSHVKISDFKGKLLILDFWATYCVPCLKLLPHYDSLQRKFANQLQFFLISRESAAKVNGFFAKHSYDLPSATSDELLTRIFRHVGIPHEVWIKDGKVLATSFGDDVNESTIRSALDDKPLKMGFKVDDLTWDSTQPLLINGNGGVGKVSYLSLITPYLNGVRPSSGFVRNNEHISSIYTNTTVVALYHQAFSHIDPLLNFDNRLILQVPDSLKGKLDRPDNVNLTEWMKSNAFCYNLVLPPNYNADIGDLMVKDLNNFFSTRFNIYAHLEKFTVDCLVLSRAISGQSLGSAGGKPMLEADDHHFKMIGYRMDDFILFLAESLRYQPKPLINDTEFKGIIDVDLNARLDDLPAIQKGLLKSGLSLTVQRRTIEMIVISNVEPLTKQSSTTNN